MGIVIRKPRTQKSTSPSGGSYQWVKLTWNLPADGLCQINEIKVNDSSPQSVYASSQYDASTFKTANAIDADTGTTWSSASGNEGDPVWIAVKMSTSQAVAKYAYYPRTNNVTLAPSGFSLYGSNDSTNGSDGTWTLIASGLTRSDNTVRWHEWTL